MTRPLILLFIFTLLANPAICQSEVTGDEVITVGIRTEPPFVMKENDGTYYGLSIDLWYLIANDLKLQYEFKEYNDHLGLLRALDYDEIDLSINPFAINGARLRLFEAAQPFFISGIGLATAGGTTHQFKVFLSNLFSANFIRLVVILVTMIFIFGLTIYFIEKKTNPKQFEGLLDGFWWSVVTMTTVGYGDKTPKSAAGRIISVAWMFIAIVLISSFTATIASTMTVNTLESRIEKFEDIKTLERIGTVEFSRSKEFLQRNKIDPEFTYPDVLEGLIALNKGEIDVFVYDKPAMRYLITENELNSIKIMPLSVNEQYLCFLMPKESALGDRINPQLVDRINTRSWKKNLTKYHLDKEK